jgi:hypothetical protein
MLMSPAMSEARENPVTTELTSVFISACLDGELQLVPGRVEEVDAKDVAVFATPSRNAKNARYYRLGKPAKAALIVSDQDPPTDRGFARTCSVTTRGHDVETAWHLVSQAMDGKPARHIPDTVFYTIDHPAAGYSIHVGSSLLRIGHYTAEEVQKARLRPGGAKKMTVTAVASLYE